MKISNRQVRNLLAKYASEVEQDKRPEGSDAPGRERPGDSLELSEKARQLRRITEVVEQMPEVRREKVAEIKRKIRNGNYEVSSEEVAEKMIEELETGEVQREER